MKTTRYHLERVIEGASANNIKYVENEIQEVLESNKDYRTKADYLGFSICSLDDKVQVIEEQVKELLEYKKRLLGARLLAIKVGAEVFKTYGIEKLEGAGIESITLTKESSSSKTNLVIKNEQALIDGGFYKTIKVLDTDSILNSYKDGLYHDLILQNAYVDTKVTVIPSMLKVNRRDTVTTRLTS